MQGCDRCRDGIAWKAEERDVIPDRAEGERTPGAQEQFPEVHGSQLIHQRPDPVGVTGGDATGADHNVAVNGQFMQALAQGLGLVSHHPSVGHRLSKGLEHGFQERSIALPDGTGGPHRAGWDEFITADQDSNPGFRNNLQVSDPAAGEASQIRCPQSPACFQKRVSRLAFLMCRPNPGTIRGLFHKAKGRAIHSDKFLGQHPAGTLRQRSSREDSNRFTSGERAIEGLAGG